MFSSSSNTSAIQKKIRKVQKKQLFAMSEALNQTAKLAAKDQLKRADRVFDRPTPFTRKMIFNPSRKLGFMGIPSKFNTLEVQIIPGGHRGAFSEAGKRIQDVLRLETKGGRRRPPGRALPVPVNVGSQSNQYGGMRKTYIKNLLNKKDHVSLGPAQGLPAGIYRRMGKGRLKMVIAWEPVTKYKAIFNFEFIARATFKRRFAAVYKQEFRREMKELLQRL